MKQVNKTAQLDHNDILIILRKASTEKTLDIMVNKICKNHGVEFFEDMSFKLNLYISSAGTIAFSIFSAAIERENEIEVGKYCKRAA